MPLKNCIVQYLFCFFLFVALICMRSCVSVLYLLPCDLQPLMLPFFLVFLLHTFLAVQIFLGIFFARSLFLLLILCSLCTHSDWCSSTDAWDVRPPNRCCCHGCPFFFSSLFNTYTRINVISNAINIIVNRTAHIQTQTYKPWLTTMWSLMVRVIERERKSMYYELISLAMARFFVFAVAKPMCEWIGVLFWRRHEHKSVTTTAAGKKWFEHEH